MSQAPASELIGSALSIALNASGFGLHNRTRGFWDGETLDLGHHKLRFIEAPDVHHWDSMMVIEETTGSVFSSDPYLQPGEQPLTLLDDETGLAFDPDYVVALRSIAESREPALSPAPACREPDPAPVRAARPRVR